jgi:hypothetical protein
MNNLTLYCNCYNEHENLHTQFDQKNIMCGSVNLDLDYKAKLLSKNFLFDDTGDNISHLNEYFSDLTGLYWVWKNTDHEFVGTNQYRRFYDDNAIKQLKYDDKTIYVSEPYSFGKSNTYAQYVYNHGEMGLLILKEAAKRGKINLDVALVDKLRTINFLSPANMFFTQNKVFNKLCSIMFEMVFEIYEGTKYSLPYIQEPIKDAPGYNNNRVPAFLAERILNIIYIEKEYYLGKDYDVVSVPWRHYA